MDIEATTRAIAVAVRAALDATGAGIRVPTPRFPDDFLADPARKWREFRKEWNSYCVCTKLPTKPQEMQFHTFMVAVGKAGRTLYDGFQFLEGENKEILSVVLEKFESFSMGTQTDISLRAEFYRRSQKEGETTSAFISDLFRLAEHCNFANKDNMVRDRIALGIKCEVLRERIFREHHLDLNKVIDLCRSDEAAKAQSLALREPASRSFQEEVNVFDRYE